MTINTLLILMQSIGIRTNKEMLKLLEDVYAQFTAADTTLILHKCYHEQAKGILGIVDEPAPTPPASNGSSSTSLATATPENKPPARKAASSSTLAPAPPANIARK